LFGAAATHNRLQNVNMNEPQQPGLRNSLANGKYWARDADILGQLLLSDGDILAVRHANKRVSSSSDKSDFGDDRLNLRLSTTAPRFGSRAYK
jgi:hypothetical protein